MDKEYIKITFPDGRKQDFKYGITGYDIGYSKKHIPIITKESYCN